MNVHSISGRFGPNSSTGKRRGGAACRIPTQLQRLNGHLDLYSLWAQFRHRNRFTPPRFAV